MASITNLWNFSTCKEIIRELRRPYPSGTLKNWRKCLEFLASLIDMDATLMYNTLSPNEYFARLGIREVPWWNRAYYSAAEQRRWPWNLWSLSAEMERSSIKWRAQRGIDFVPCPLPGTLVV